MSRIIKSGHIADKSGQYGIVNKNGKNTDLEVTVTKGEPLPPTPKPGQTFVLNDKTKHKSGK